MNSSLIEKTTAEFPVGNNSHVMVLLWTDCIILIPGVLTGDGYLLADTPAERCYRLDMFPEFAHVYTGQSWNLPKLHALLYETYLATRVQ